MNIFTHPSYDKHQKIHFHHDQHTGLKAIIAMHRISSEPCVGGCRLWRYETEGAAINDVLRLSKGMTYKSMMANLPYGGSKCVILDDDTVRLDRRAIFEAMGDFIESLHGSVRTGVDVGLTEQDITTLKTRTKYIVGTGSVLPEIATACGVYMAIKASVAFKTGYTNLSGMSVAIQGLGKVGFDLAKRLCADGVEVIGSDLNEDNINRARDELCIKVVSPGKIHSQNVDIFSPCAMGAIINEDTIGSITAKMVVGSANNQLKNSELGAELKNCGILYAPDYVANAGGLLAVASDIENKSSDWVWEKTIGIADTLTEVFELADSDGISTSDAADRIARSRMEELIRRNP